MAGLACDYCERVWPTGPLDSCPCCREPLTRVERTPQDWDGAALTEDAAAKLKVEFDFGWWLYDTGRL